MAALMRKPEIPALTGLRGVAALMVVINHYAAGAAPFPLAEAPTALMALVAMPGLGMTLFFTLSGFVIVYNYLDLPWREQPLSSFGRFAWHRISRLYPGLLLFLFICLTPDLLRMEDGWKWILLHVFSVDTVLPVKLMGHLPGGWIFHVSWSIGTEFAMYAAFAALMLLAGRIGQVAIAVLVAGYCAAVLYLMNSPRAFSVMTSVVPVIGGPFDEANWVRWFWYISPYYRLLEFCLGAMAALVILRRPMAVSHHSFAWLSPIAVCALIGLHTYWFTASSRISPPALQLTSAILFSLLMLGAQHDNRTNRVLSSGPLILIGTASYSLYLFHNFAPAPYVFGGGRPFALMLVPPMIIDLATRLLIAIAMAWGLYQIVERPAQSWLRRLIPDRPRPTVTAAAIPVPAE
jgi:peptidoglycan/LPS O-acetylase OafA/YrhL